MHMYLLFPFRHKATIGAHMYKSFYIYRSSRYVSKQAQNSGNVEPKKPKKTTHRHPLSKITEKAKRLQVTH